jgi:hypothetical protein
VRRDHHLKPDPRRMTGLQHYREAERLLAESMRPDSYDYPAQQADRYVAAAQVHAILALAAATMTGGQFDINVAGNTQPGAEFDPAQPDGFA